VLGDVLLGALERVAARQVVVQVRRGLAENAGIGLFEQVAILQEEAEQGGEVINLDVAVHVGGGKADGAAAQGLAEHPEILEAKNRMLAGRGTTERSRAPVWQDHGHGPML